MIQMKKLVFILMPVIGFAQQKITIDFDANTKDATHSVKDVSVVDLRMDKNPGTVTSNGAIYVYKLPADFTSTLAARFDKDNKQKGSRNIVVLLEDIKVWENNTGKKTVPAAHVRASSFEKKGGQYYYLTSIDKNVGTLDVQNTMTPKALPIYFKNDFSGFLKASYKAKPSATALSESDLPSYFTVLSSALPAFTAPVKDGVYESYTSFFNQTPAEGFVIEKNSEGKVIRAKKGAEKIAVSKMWAYVENGKIYKNTYSGFMPVEKNDKGYYIISNRGELEAVQANPTYGMFGLVGGIAGAIAQDAKQDRAKKAEKKPIYLDPLTGSYIY